MTWLFGSIIIKVGRKWNKMQDAPMVQGRLNEMLRVWFGDKELSRIKLRILLVP